MSFTGFENVFVDLGHPFGAAVVFPAPFAFLAMMGAAPVVELVVAVVEVEEEAESKHLQRRLGCGRGYGDGFEVAALFAGGGDH